MSRETMLKGQTDLTIRGDMLLGVSGLRKENNQAKGVMTQLYATPIILS